MLHTINLVCSLALAIFAVYMVAMIHVEFNKATSTRTGLWNKWDRLIIACRNSATMLWMKFCMILAGVVGNLDQIATFLGAPELSTFINTWIGNPKVIAAIMLGIAFVGAAARKRTL